MLSPAVEDYLKAVYKLEATASHAEAPVTTSALAETLDRASASVTNMAKRLDARGLVRHQSYKGVRLTDAGRAVALEIIRHHRLLELYLKEVMDYSWAQLHEEAEHLEHHISEEFERKLEELLDHPTHDPHGHPIPTRDGTVAEVPTEPLAEADTGQRVVVRHLSDSDPALLDHLEACGLLPGTELAVVEKAPFDGPLTVRLLREAAEDQLVGQRVAQSVFVASAAS